MFLMSQGPSFEVNSRCEMGVLCLFWYGLPLHVKKNSRFVWPEKASLNVTLKPCHLRLQSHDRPITVYAFFSPPVCLVTLL